jgi:hypothetical protein
VSYLKSAFNINSGYRREALIEEGWYNFILPAH